ncbi:hypothetical protein ACROYT_G018744 [Oculina patagonica]
MSLDLSSQPITDTCELQFCVEMMKRLDIQRRNEQFCDVILDVGSGDDQTRLKAHRIVLCAASPFFYNALNSDMKEKKEGVIRLEETSKAVMEEVLEYLYTGHVDINEHNAFDLLQIADFLVLPSLKELSSKVILRTLTSSNCIKAYCYAMRYQCPELEKRARKFSFRNFMDVTQSDDFLDLNVTQVEKWVSSDDIVVKGEEEVFQVIVKWMERDESRKHESFSKLFCHVRLVYMSRNYVFNVILPHSLVKDSATCTALALDAMKELTYGSEECFFSQLPRRCLKTHEDAIVVCGGWKETLCYLPSENKWYKTAHMPPSIKEIGSSLTSCHGRLYITGENRADELDVTNQVSGRVHKYNPDTNLWQEVAPLNVARCAVCAVADKNSLYAIGGLSVNGDSDDVEVFDPEKNSWRKLASTLTKKKKLCCGAVVRGKVFVFENVPRQTLCAMEMYGPATNTWSSIEWMDAPKMSLSAVNFKGKIFVLGTWERDGSHKFAIKVYDVDKNEWTYLSSIPSGGQVFNLAPLRIQRNILDRCKVVSSE